MDDGAPLTVGRICALKHTTRWVRAKVVVVDSRVDVDTLHEDRSAIELALNEIGRVRLRTTAPVLVDAYRENRITGSFVLVDESTNRTVGAGLLTGSRSV